MLYLQQSGGLVPNQAHVNHANAIWWQYSIFLEPRSSLICCWGNCLKMLWNVWKTNLQELRNLFICKELPFTSSETSYKMSWGSPPGLRAWFFTVWRTRLVPFYILQYLWCMNHGLSHHFLLTVPDVNTSRSVDTYWFLFFSPSYCYENHLNDISLTVFICWSL